MQTTTPGRMALPTSLIPPVTALPHRSRRVENVKTAIASLTEKELSTEPATEEGAVVAPATGEGAVVAPATGEGVVLEPATEEGVVGDDRQSARDATRTSTASYENRNDGPEAEPASHALQDTPDEELFVDLERTKTLRELREMCAAAQLPTNGKRKSELVRQLMDAGRSDA